MFIKLLKNEFIEHSKFYIKIMLSYILLIILQKTSNAAGLDFIGGFLFSLIFATIPIMLFIPIIYSLINYSQTVHGRRASFTHSIPVKPLTIVISKWIVTCTWTLIISSILSVVVKYWYTSIWLGLPSPTGVLTFVIFTVSFFAFSITLGNSTIANRLPIHPTSIVFVINCIIFFVIINMTSLYIPMNILKVNDVSSLSIKHFSIPFINNYVVVFDYANKIFSSVSYDNIIFVMPFGVYLTILFGIILYNGFISKILKKHMEN